MNGVFFPCCGQWHPSPASHRTSVRGVCVVAALRKPMKERPDVSPAPAQPSWGYYIR
jgi:hypothetical protein